MDDGLISCRTSEEAVELRNRTQSVLHANGKLKLHKFTFNNRNVLDSLPQNDLAKDLCIIDLSMTRYQYRDASDCLWTLKQTN